MCLNSIQEGASKYWLSIFSFFLLGFTLALKLEKFWFWNSMKYFSVFYKKEIYIYIYICLMSHEKMSDFVSFLLLGFTLVIKLRNFDFEIEKKWCSIWLCPVKQCLIWFEFRFFSRILAISWEIRNFFQMA